ncbi:DUF1450 domain-containing protein [Gorillibacterium sp. sgz500922]|uniref:DUF1450 domain-containing protein n=1 Tax=Gorillibacterium sp. sgz500922 TaxID=3446694 RepID=UPI003F674C36
MGKKNELHVCPKCKHIKAKKLAKELAELDPNAKVKIGCMSYCEPCKRSALICVNGRYLTASTQEELLEKAKSFLK